MLNNEEHVEGPEGQRRDGEVHHRPWMLRSAEAKFAQNTIGRKHDLDLSGVPVLVHYAARQDALAWLPERM